MNPTLNNTEDVLDMYQRLELEMVFVKIVTPRYVLNVVITLTMTLSQKYKYVSYSFHI